MIKRYITFLILLIFAASLFCFPQFSFASTALEYDSSNVLDDLQGSETFNLDDYPKNPYGKVQIINFVEYCYSYYENGSANYGLYIYVYNPALLELSKSSAQNKIQISVSFDAAGNASDYAKFGLSFINKSVGENNKLFYKFKVVDVSGTILSVVKNYAKTHNGVRRYAVSGVELLTAGEILPVDYTVATTYDYSGFAEGYGNSSDFPLSVQAEQLETVSLDVKHTFYRTESSSKGAGYQNQLDTVYFAVPNELLNAYGNLQRIKAEWYEYKTKDIIVTNNDAFYDAVLPYMGYYTGSSYIEDIGYCLAEGPEVGEMSLIYSWWDWNTTARYIYALEKCETLYYLLYADVGQIRDYDPYADIVQSGGVDGNILYNYIKNYNASYESGYVSIKDDLISADLFAADIDDYRKKDTFYGKIQQGYSYYDFDADIDLHDMVSWADGDPSFWDNIRAWGLWDTIFGRVPEETGDYNIPPIYAIKAGDLDGTPGTVSDRLFVHTSDVSALRDYTAAAAAENKTVFLFRFATTDYYSAPVTIIEPGKGFLGTDKWTDGKAYRAWQSVFFNFDVIQLTFKKDGIYHVIPVVSSPIDIINPITPPANWPEDGFDWLKLLLGLLALILILVLLAPLLPFIFNFIIWIIVLPFRLIGRLFKALKKGGDKP